MDKNLYCSIIHGGLNLDFKFGRARAQSCCLRNDMFDVDHSVNFWNDKKFQPLRQKNLTNQWDSGCYNCRMLESSGNLSFREGMNQGLEIVGNTQLTGPARIDLMFDISCNLACVICGPHASTSWQKHLKENNLYNQQIFTPRKKNQVIDALSQLDLSNLRMLVFCGGETLLGQEYWDVAAWLADNVPDAKTKLTLCFQTNGTQPILPKNFEIIEKFFLVKLHISLDGICKQFEYLRWPAKWNQTVDNIQELKLTLPSNVMFVIEETISIFNLIYIDRLENWVKENFSSNREGDIVDHTKHLVNHNFYSLESLSNEYVDFLKNTKYENFIPTNFVENPSLISDTIKNIKKFDSFRGQDFTKVFPDLAQFYSRWI